MFVKQPYTQISQEILPKDINKSNLAIMMNKINVIMQIPKFNYRIWGNFIFVYSYFSVKENESSIEKAISPLKSTSNHQ